MQRILIQLDTDSIPSTFDRVVAIDAGVEQLFSYGGVSPDNVEGLVHGAMFTRKPSDLKSTALFIGGSQVAAGEAVLKKVLATFFGPVRCSVMMDSNGSNTTAAAAVLAAAKHLVLKQTTATILGGTGPVGFRVAQILLDQGATVRLGSRTLDKATAACELLTNPETVGRITPHATAGRESLLAACSGSQVIFGAGAAGVELLDEQTLFGLTGLKVAIDLNAVAPAGLGGIGIMDKAVDKRGVLCYGAIGVGGTKMKIHKAALAELFTSNDRVLDTARIFTIGEQFAKA